MFTPSLSGSSSPLSRALTHSFSWPDFSRCQGTLRVVGSSLFLKARFGIGYHLDVDLTPTADPSAVLAAVRTHVPLARVDSDAPPAAATEMNLVLPLGEEVTYRFLSMNSEEFLFLPHCFSVLVGGVYAAFQCIHLFGSC